MTREQRLGPVGVIKLQRHAGDHQQQEARDHQEMQKPLERHETRKPFVVRLRFDLRFAECFWIVQIQINGAHQPDDGVQPEERKHADQQAGHAQEHGVQQRIIFAVERIGVRLVFRETGRGIRMTLLAGAEDVRFGQTRRGIGRRQHVVMAVAVVTGGDVGGHVRFAQRHGFAVISVAIMFEPVLVAFAAALRRSPF